METEPVSLRVLSFFCLIWQAYGKEYLWKVSEKAMKKLFLLCLLILVPFFCGSFLCANPVGLFAHGFWDFADQAGIYKDMFAVPLKTFSFPDAQDRRIHLSRVNMAQKDDMNALWNAYENLINEGDSVFFVGLSRGASTIITLMSTKDLDKVKAVILESPFSCLECVVESLVRRRLHLGWVPWLTATVNYLVPYVFRQYDKNGIKPIDVIQNLPKELPILIVCSKQDTLVPASSSIDLYELLRETGHDHAYLLVLDDGEHSKLVFGSDVQRYKDVLNAFCKRYGLPYDKSAADRGMEELDRSQPEVSSD